MDKSKLIVLKKRLLALGLSGIMLGTTGCTINKIENKSGEPKRISISDQYNNFENYYKYAIKDGEVEKLYKSQNVFLLFNKESYEVNEYIFTNEVSIFGGGELYDLETEEMLFYHNGISTHYNSDFFEYLAENNYQVCLNEINDYVESHDIKEYYSLYEIKELEPLIKESLIIINKTKEKTLEKKNN